MPRTRSRIVLPTSVFIVGATLGCANQAAQTVRTRAATDFSCSEEAIELNQLTGSLNIYEYTASGCGKSDNYQAKCGYNLFMCKAKTFDEIDRHNEAVEQDYKRAYGCHYDSSCVEKHGPGHICVDYVCKKG